MNLNDRAYFKNKMGQFLCSKCESSFIPAEPYMYSSSGKYLNSVRALGVYDNSLMKAIHCFKYKGKLQLKLPLSSLLFYTFLKYFKNEKIDIIIPVPLHKKRFRSRGFNQAFLLIQNWTNMLNIIIDRDNLVRKRYTRPQVGLGKIERINNIYEAFTIIDSSIIKDKKILLIDDVYTTGATANECARILISKGATEVNVLTLAIATN
ncbi:MAG: ComF family protein [Desulfobacterales bacterium]|nr:ComF family protein [Desulfobacterales bacterium]